MIFPDDFPVGRRVRTKPEPPNQATHAGRVAGHAVAERHGGPGPFVVVLVELDAGVWLPSGDFLSLLPCHPDSLEPA